MPIPNPAQPPAQARPVPGPGQPPSSGAAFTMMQFSLATPVEEGSAWPGQQPAPQARAAAAPMAAAPAPTLGQTGWAPQGDSLAQNFGGDDDLVMFDSNPGTYDDLASGIPDFDPNDTDTFDISSYF
jgi:hypothetical protein